MRTLSGRLSVVSAFQTMSHASHGTRNGRAPANTARACARGYVNGPRLERRAHGGIARGKPCCKHAAAGGSSGTTRQGATGLIRDADGNTGMFRRPPIPVKAIWLRIPRRPLHFAGTALYIACSLSAHTRTGQRVLFPATANAYDRLRPAGACDVAADNARPSACVQAFQLPAPCSLSAGTRAR